MLSNLLITGGSRGIGAATALMAASRGWNVAINYARDARAAEDVAQAVRAQGHRAITVQADVADEAQVLAMFARLDREFGPLAGLVNNAGVVAMASRFVDIGSTRLQRMFAVNVFGTMACTRQAVLRMSTRLGGAGGAIVNLSSVAAVLGSPGLYVDYAAAKGAIDSFTIGLGRELACEGVRVNAVRPGIVDTEIHADSGDAQRGHKSIPLIPMQRLGRAEEIAESVLWLLSPAASYVTGSVLNVSGGR